MTNSVIRYTDAELAEFKALIEKKLEKSQEQLASLQEQILEITENSSDEHGGDWVDDSSINNDVEMLNNMAIRQRMYIQELENALVRIRNKTYGICTVTGELIDKRRLMAVPTTTKSLAAKTEQPQAPERKPAQRPVKPKHPKSQSAPKVITKIIRKSNSSSPKPKIAADDDDDLYDDDLFFGDEDETPMRKVSKNLGQISDDDVDDLEILTDDLDSIADDDISDEDDEDDEKLDF